MAEWVKAIPRHRKRGYSKDFTPHGTTGKRYTLDDIPAGFWTQVRTKAAREGVSMRGLILQLLATWLQAAPPAAGDGL